MPSQYLWDDFKHYPIHVILGDVGTGKSLLACYLAWLASNDPRKPTIFANFHLIGIPYHYLRYYKEKDPKTGKMVQVNDLITGKAQDGTPIKNGVLFWDEPQSTGINSHNFFDKDTEELSSFVSQIRKDDIALFMMTQRDNFIVWNVRQLTAFVYEIHPTEEKGVIDIVRRNMTTGEFLDKVPIRKDLRGWFNMYNSKEKIGVKHDD